MNEDKFSILIWLRRNTWAVLIALVALYFLKPDAQVPEQLWALLTAVLTGTAIDFDAFTSNKKKP